MLTKDILQKLIGTIMVHDNKDFIILSADDLIEIYDLNHKTKTKVTIEKFQSLLLLESSVYTSDETDDLIPLIEFIKDI